MAAYQASRTSHATPGRLARKCHLSNGTSCNQLITPTPIMATRLASTMSAARIRNGQRTGARGTMPGDGFFTGVFPCCSKRVAARSCLVFGPGGKRSDGPGIDCRAFPESTICMMGEAKQSTGALQNVNVPGESPALFHPPPRLGRAALRPIDACFRAHTSQEKETRRWRGKY